MKDFKIELEGFDGYKSNFLDFINDIKTKDSSKVDIDKLKSLFENEYTDDNLLNIIHMYFFGDKEYFLINSEEGYYFNCDPETNDNIYITENGFVGDEKDMWSYSERKGDIEYKPYNYTYFHILKVEKLVNLIKKIGITPYGIGKTVDYYDEGVGGKSIDGTYINFIIKRYNNRNNTIKPLSLSNIEKKLNNENSSVDFQKEQTIDFIKRLSAKGKKEGLTVNKKNFEDTFKLHDSIGYDILKLNLLKLHIIGDIRMSKFNDDFELDILNDKILKLQIEGFPISGTYFVIESFICVDDEKNTDNSFTFRYKEGLNYKKIETKSGKKIQIGGIKIIIKRFMNNNSIEIKQSEEVGKVQNALSQVNEYFTDYLNGKELITKRSKNRKMYRSLNSEIDIKK